MGKVKQDLIEDLPTGRVRVTDLPNDVEKMLDEMAQKREEATLSQVKPSTGE